MNTAIKALKRIIKFLETNAIELDLSDCCLEEIPSEVFELKNLVILKLSQSFDLHRIDLHRIDLHRKDRNQISHIPKEIGKLKKLEYLDIRYNLLTTLPAEIGNLTQLKYLYLNDNHLVSLPKELWQLKNIKEH